MTATTLAWLMLVGAGLLEIIWAISLKHTEGFTKLWPSVFTLAVMGLSFYLLAKAVMRLPVGTAYAVWVGIGAAGAAILGIVLFNESASPQRLAFLVLLIVSIVGLKMTSNS